MTFRVAILVIGLLLPASALAQEPEPVTLPPECGTTMALGDGLASAFYEIARMIYAIGTTIAPHAGFTTELDQGNTRFSLSWPLQYAFGTVTGSTKLQYGCGKTRSEDFHAHRVVLEPIALVGVTNDKLDLDFEVRPAYRFVFHREDEVIGFGAGMGSTIQFNDGLRASLSPELIVQYGRCCTPSFLTMSMRYDRYFARDSRDAVSATLGWSFW